MGWQRLKLHLAINWTTSVTLAQHPLYPPLPKHVLAFFFVCVCGFLFFFFFGKSIYYEIYLLHLFLTAQYCMNSTTLYYPTGSVGQEWGRHSWLTGSSHFSHKPAKGWWEVSSHLAVLGRTHFQAPSGCGQKALLVALSWGCPQLFGQLLPQPAKASLEPVCLDRFR